MAQPQEYTVASWSAWQDRDNDGAPVRDQHGNYKGSVTFEEDRSEPIDATFKTQPEPGDKKFGTVDMYQTKAGKVRKGFKSAQRPNPAYGGGYGQAPQQAGQVAQGKYGKQDEHTQESIARSVALKAAVDTMVPIIANMTEMHPDVAVNIKRTAESYLAWLQGSSEKVTYPVYQSDERGKPTKIGEQTVSVPANRPWERITKKPEPDYPPDEGMAFEGEQIPDYPPDY